jgi:hypothetical protein
MYFFISVVTTLLTIQTICLWKIAVVSKLNEELAVYQLTEIAKRRGAQFQDHLPKK